jgi:hypothetical protein
LVPGGNAQLVVECVVKIQVAVVQGLFGFRRHSIECCPGLVVRAALAVRPGHKHTRQINT